MWFPAEWQVPTLHTSSVPVQSAAAPATQAPAAQVSSTVHPSESALHSAPSRGIGSFAQAYASSPVEVQTPELHWSFSALQSGVEPAVQVPAWQASPTVQPLESALQVTPSRGTGSFAQV